MYLHIFTSSLSNSSSHPFQFPNQRRQHTHNPRSSNLCSLSRNPVVESFSLSSPSTSVPGRFLSNQATGDLCICETLPCLCFEVSSNSLSLRVLWLCCAVPLLDFQSALHEQISKVHVRHQYVQRFAGKRACLQAEPWPGVPWKHLHCVWSLVSLHPPVPSLSS